MAAPTAAAAHSSQARRLLMVRRLGSAGWCQCVLGGAQSYFHGAVVCMGAQEPAQGPQISQHPLRPRRRTSAVHAALQARLHRVLLQALWCDYGQRWPGGTGGQRRRRACGCAAARGLVKERQCSHQRRWGGRRKLHAAPAAQAGDPRKRVCGACLGGRRQRRCRRSNSGCSRRRRRRSTHRRSSSAGGAARAGTAGGRGR